ncbi:MAG: ABC transporter permease [Candidatus Eisenbacteria sp.]|nr:ABC transporter permease [Candidatus Eisenbacteria bacterium]
MKWFEYIAVALSAVRNHKLRSGLTALGIIIGVAAVITMVSLGQGARKAVGENLQSLGSNLLSIRPGSQALRHVRMGEGTSRTLRAEDATAVLESPYVAEAVPEFSGGGQLKRGNSNWSTRIVGTHPELAPVRNLDLDEGRFFSRREVFSSARVCVVGKTVYDNLFGGGSAVDTFIRVRNINFRVVGVLREKGYAGWWNQDDVIYVPLTTAQRRLFGEDHVSSISVQVWETGMTDDAIVDIERILRKRHRLLPDQDNDFYVRSYADIARTFQEATETFSYLLLSIALVSLLVGGIGIMNIMLVSVTERTKEIGIRKAIGARSRDIRWQFLAEAISLCLLGGGLGVVLGVASAQILTRAAQWNLEITWLSIAVSFGFSFIVGVFFGYLPAQRAARLRPIEALRHE